MRCFLVCGSFVYRPRRLMNAISELIGLFSEQSVLATDGTTARPNGDQASYIVV